MPPQRRFDEEVEAEEPKSTPVPNSVEKEPDDAGDAILGYLGGVESLQKEKMSESASDFRLNDDDDDINDVIIVKREVGDTGVVAVEDKGL